MKPTKALLFTTTALLLLLLEGCATVIKDSTWCSPIPGTPDAACDNFLTSNPEIVNWAAQESTWNAQGFAVECTTSATFANLKAAIEQLCSHTPCDNETENAKKIILAAIERSERKEKYATQYRSHRLAVTPDQEWTLP